MVVIDTGPLGCSSTNGAIMGRYCRGRLQEDVVVRFPVQKTGGDGSSNGLPKMWWRAASKFVAKIIWDW
ncbi:hypothetical protein ACNKHV_08885 [Shigella flexneri]